MCKNTEVKSFDSKIILEAKVKFNNEILANAKIAIKENELNKYHNKFIRNIIVKSLYLQEVSKGEIGKMDIYAKIENDLKEKFNIDFEGEGIRHMLWKMNKR